MPSCFLKDLRNDYCWACTLFESQTSGVAFSLNHFQGYHFPSTLTGQVSDQNTCLFCRALHQMPGSLNKIEGIPKSDWSRIQLLPSSCRKPVTTMVQEKVWCSKCITTMILSQPCIPYVHEYTTRLDSLTTEKKIKNCTVHTNSVTASLMLIVNRFCAHNWLPLLHVRHLWLALAIYAKSW